MPIVRPVVLSGGAGTRLWPLSTTTHPKQFLDLLGEPLLQATLARLAGVAGATPPTIVTGADHLGEVEEAALRAGVEVGSIIVEPVGRNTAPAVVAAALIADPADILVVAPSDHSIADVAAFRVAIEAAVSMAGDDVLIVFGVPASRPETGYGYIETGEPVGVGHEVTRFKEKPEQVEAERFVAEGGHLWNCGIFVFTAQRILDEASRYEPGLVEQVRGAMPDGRSGVLHLDTGFAEVKSISIDHAVMERTERAVVIPMEVGWDDVGSWQSVWELSPHDEDGNVLHGDITALEVSGSYIVAGSRRVAVAGVDGLVVVETPEAVLVVPLDRSQLVRELVARTRVRASPD